MKELYEPINQRLNNEEYNAVGGYRAFLRDLARLDKTYENTPNKGPMSNDVLYEFVTSLEGVKMLIRTGVEVLSMDYRREMSSQQPNLTVMVPWLKDSLIGSLSQVTTLFGQAFRSTINVNSALATLPSIDQTKDTKQSSQNSS